MQPIAKLPHTPATAVVENRIPATCTTAGSYDDVVYCAECKTELSRTSQTIDALGHATVQHAAQAPTCTEIGWEAYETCSRCDYTTYVEIAATGHKYQTTVTAPTCEAQGFTTYTCAHDATHTYVDNYVDALGHAYSSQVTTQPSCTS